MQTLFEHAGGRPALHRFVDAFYTSVLADPVLQPLFGAGRPEHVDQLTAFDCESLGRPDEFTRTMGGFAHLVEVHRGLRITEPQRRRFVELYLAAADTAELPADPGFRQALRSHVEFGSRVAMQNSHARTDDELHPLHDVPHWHWPQGRTPVVTHHVPIGGATGRPWTSGPEVPPVARTLMCPGFCGVGLLDNVSWQPEEAACLRGIHPSSVARSWTWWLLAAQWRRSLPTWGSATRRSTCGVVST